MPMPKPILELVQKLETASNGREDARARMSRRAANLIRRLYENDEPIEESPVDSH